MPYRCVYCMELVTFRGPDAIEHGGVIYWRPVLNNSAGARVFSFLSIAQVTQSVSLCPLNMMPQRICQGEYGIKLYDRFLAYTSDS